MSTELHSLVVGVTESDSSRRAFEWACRQAGDGTIAAVHAFPPANSLFAASVMIDIDPAREREVELLPVWAAPPAWSEAQIATTLVDEDPVVALTSSAAARPGSVIVIGQHLSGHLGDHHLSHVASRLLHAATHPLVVVNATAAAAPIDKMVVVAVHGPTEANRRPIEFGARLAAESGAGLHLVTVAAESTAERSAVNPYGYGAVSVDLVAVRDEMSAALDDLARQVSADWPGVDVSGTTLTGHPVTALAKWVDEVGADIVVVGNHHHSALVSVVTDSVLRHLPTLVSCAVAAVPVKSDD